MTLSTTRITNGYHRVFWNGQKTPYMIINGSLGLSGRNTQNHYGFYREPDAQGNGGTPTKWVGSLASCKKILAYTFTKNPDRAKRGA